MTAKPHIAHLAGPTATVQNSPPLVTSNKARVRARLPVMEDATGAPLAFDALRAQRLAAPVTVYVEQFSAHPLEADAADLYALPDGYVDAGGVFHKERQGAGDKPVYEIELKPEDGLYPMPYMALQADGSPWEEECTSPGASDEGARQGFYPDGSRSFEEIDRLAVGDDGRASLISSRADVDFYRGLPPGGYRKGLAAELRTDMGEGDIPPEVRGRDFFPYKPYHLASAPPRPTLAKMTNDMQTLVNSGQYDGFMWTQGSPQVEETAYWYNLLIDTDKPICGNAAQRPNGQISNDGPKNLLDSVSFIASGRWAGEDGRNSCGTVVIQEQQIFAAREVAKADARPGGYVATGGHGGIIGQFSHLGALSLTYLPVFKHTYQSEVNINRLPTSVQAARRSADGGIEFTEVVVKDTHGRLLPDAIPVVSITKDGSYSGLEIGDDALLEEDLAASIEHKLTMGKLAGFVVEGMVPYGTIPAVARNKLMLKAAFSGLPVAKAARGSAEGFADPHDFQIAAANLTGTKARLLLMACLLKFGSLPPAKDPDNPTPAEMDAVREALARYKTVFESH